MTALSRGDVFVTFYQRRCSMSIVLASVLLVAVVLFLLGLSLGTLRQFSGQDSPLELVEDDHYSKDC